MGRLALRGGKRELSILTFLFLSLTLSGYTEIAVFKFFSAFRRGAAVRGGVWTTPRRQSAKAARTRCSRLGGLSKGNVSPQTGGREAASSVRRAGSARGLSSGLLRPPPTPALCPRTAVPPCVWSFSPLLFHKCTSQMGLGPTLTASF